MVIEVIDRETYETTNRMYKNFAEYSEWLYRAVKRGYGVADCGEYVYICCCNSKEKNDFRAYEH